MQTDSTAHSMEASLQCLAAQFKLGILEFGLQILSELGEKHLLEAFRG
jgi:hypothetical protein